MAVVLALFVPVACSTAPADPEAGELTVFAAASLQDVFEDLEVAWQAEYPDSRLIVAHDGSNVLAAQIGEGAPADVFVSADLERPRQLIAGGHATGAVVSFAGNRVTLVAPTDDLTVSSPADLARPGIRIVAAAAGVPISDYAETALAELAATMPHPGGFIEAVHANVVSREDNVRAALAKVELGEGDAAFVYGSDVATSTAVREVPLPASVVVTAEYGVVQVSAKPMAAAFVEWLRGPEAAAVLEAAGFLAAPR